MRESKIEKLEQVTLLVISGLCIFVSFAHFFGVLESFPFLSERIPTLSLLLLGVIAVYLTLERRGMLQRIVTLENSNLQVNAFFGVLLESDRFAEIALKYGLRGTGNKIIPGKVVKVGPSQALELWRDYMWASEQWLGISYTKPNQSWYGGYGGAIAQGIQRERVSAGGTIRRVFVVDDDNEYEQLKQLMIKQEDAGIAVRWIKKDELEQNPYISENVDALQTLDLAVIDNSWVFKTNRNRESRRLEGAEAIKDQVIVEKARFVFDVAFGTGKRVER